MKKPGKLKEALIGIFVILVLCSLVFWVYRHEKSKTRADLAKRIAELSPRGGPPETVEGLKTAIALYEEQIERNVREGAQTGAYWKILAIRLADRNMYRDALAALEQALRYNSADPTLFYLTGDYAAAAAASVVGFSGNAETEREYFLTIGESSFLRAIQLDGDYPKPRLGLGMLYTFDLDRPADAVSHLERYLELVSNDINAMFVLARACYMTDNDRRAVELYDRIISRSKEAGVRAKALENRDIVRTRIYE